MDDPCDRSGPPTTIRRDRPPAAPCVGTAGWSIPSALAARFAPVGTHLERYGACLPAAEINTSFYRPHRRSTYERWAASVPAGFRFSVKLPKAITHERRLRDCAALVERFAEESGGLGGKRGPVLVQLPPSFAYPGDVAERFFEDLRAATGGVVALEPRHDSWFEPAVDRMLERQGVARVAADPAKPPGAASPGGWKGLAYLRLHGSPRIYESLYEARTVEDHAALVAALRAGGADVWTIYDNTKYGAATENALQLTAMLGLESA